MSLCSPITGQRVFSPAIAVLIFFHFFATAEHEESLQEAPPRSAGGKIAVKNQSLPLQIFWEYGEVRLTPIFRTLSVKKNVTRCHFFHYFNFFGYHDKVSDVGEVFDVDEVGEESYFYFPQKIKMEGAGEKFGN